MDSRYSLLALGKKAVRTPSPGKRRGTGSSIVNCVPRPASLCTLIRPPWASMIFRVVGSPRPEPPLLGGKKGVEDVSCVSASMPQPVSIRSRATPSGRAVGANDQLPAVGHRLLGVEHQVQQCAVKALAVQEHGRQIAGQVIDDLDPPFLGLGAEEVQHLRDLHVQIARFESQPPHLGEIEEFVQQILQPLALALDQVDLPHRPPIAGGFALAKSSARSSMFSRMVESGFLISWARPPASRAISVYWSTSF